MMFLILEDGNFYQVDSKDLTQSLLDKLRGDDAYCVRVAPGGSFEEFNAASRSFDFVDYYTDDDDDEDADRNEVRNALTAVPKVMRTHERFSTLAADEGSFLDLSR